LLVEKRCGATLLGEKDVDKGEPTSSKENRIRALFGVFTTIHPEIMERTGFRLDFTPISSGPE
jgi:hypothetical protein